MRNAKWSATVRRHKTSLKGCMGMLLAAFLVSHVTLLISSCARMGNPDGGWFDDDPPTILGSIPAEQETGVTQRKMTIYFDEYIKLDNPAQNVIVSPPQMEVPEISAKGRRIVIELQDTLLPNTTYTIDFSDAITDNNEGNPLGNYTYTFSTGEQIDTFEVSGYVVNAENLEPVKGISVGLYDDLADSAFRTKPLLRVARTDGSGHYCIRGVAPGEYRIYALQDADDNYRYTQKSEMIAFSHDTYKPWAGPDIRQDTIWRDSLHIDNILRVPYTHFYPDDVVLLAFQVPQTDRFLTKTERVEADHFSMYFTYGDSLLPVIQGLNFDADSAFIIETTPKRDTITYWLRDTTLINQDTLRMDITYRMTDTLGNLVLQTDSAVEVLAKTPYLKRQKALQKEIEDWQKEQEKKKKREEAYDSIYPAKQLQVKYDIPQSLNPGEELRITMPTPLAALDTSAIHLYSMIDSLWYRVPFEFRRRDSLLREFVVKAEWRYGTEYSFEVDSAAFTDIYGVTSAAYKTGMKVRTLNDYSSILFQLSGISDTGVVVQLLNGNDVAVREIRAAKDNRAIFDNVMPGTYYARAFVDRNGNGLWDTGDYDADLQPEDVYYYSRAIEAKAKWDNKLQWNLTARKRNEQKPDKLLKQKPDKQKKQARNRNADRARKLGIEYIKEEKKVKTKKIKKLIKQNNEDDNQ